MSWNNIVLLVIFVETLLLVIIAAYRLKLIASRKEKRAPEASRVKISCPRAFVPNTKAGSYP